MERSRNGKQRLPIEGWLLSVIVGGEWQAGAMSGASYLMVSRRLSSAFIMKVVESTDKIVIIEKTTVLVKLQKCNYLRWNWVGVSSQELREKSTEQFYNR